MLWSPPRPAVESLHCSVLPRQRLTASAVGVYLSWGGLPRSRGRPSPTVRLGPSARDSLKSRFCSSHWVFQMICLCNPLGWATVQVSFSLKSSPLKSQVAGSTGHPDNRVLWGLLGRVGCHLSGCWLHQVDLLPGVLCLFILGSFPVLWATKISL